MKQKLAFLSIIFIYLACSDKSITKLKDENAVLKEEIKCQSSIIKELEQKIKFLMEVKKENTYENPSSAFRLKSGQAPKIIKKVPLDGEWLRYARIEGMVIIEVENDIYGNVSKAIVISGHPLLIQSVIKAVLQYKYEPFIQNGCPIPVIFNVAFHFSLNRQ